ncbi:MAG: hypothetical protein KDC79_04215 [Cyclobacteriaceae bacterium]|nr:hypothetical protein [Cyclobacteriaceae bacterium]
MIDELENNKDLESFSKMGEAAKYFLRSAFDAIAGEMIYHIASELFSKTINEIDPTQEDFEFMKKASEQFSDSTIKEVIDFDSDVLSPYTQNKFSEAWEQAQKEAITTKYKFSFQHEVNGIELIGHITNLAFFIESLSNRHLFILLATNEIDNPTYNVLDRESVMGKLTFSFKTELKENKVKLGKISHLFSLRNKAVHFTAKNATNFKVTVEQLLAIWKETEEVCQLMFKKEELKSEPNFGEIISALKEDFKKRFV